MEKNNMDPGGGDVKEKILSSSPSEACRLMNSNIHGLSQEEADRRLAQYGKNELAQKKESSLVKKLLANFTSLMALLLWGGGIMAILSGALELGISIFCVNLINGFFSFFQEFKAEKATAALQKMLPAYARVVRGGEEKKIFRLRACAWRHHDFGGGRAASARTPGFCRAMISAQTSRR